MALEGIVGMDHEESSVGLPWTSLFSVEYFLQEPSRPTVPSSEDVFHSWAVPGSTLCQQANSNNKWKLRWKMTKMKSRTEIPVTEEVYR